MPYIDDDDDHGRYVACQSCDNRIDREYESYETDDCGCCFTCDECAYGRTRRRTRRGELHSYSYKPRPYCPKGNYPTEVLMGVELEVGGNQDDIVNRVWEVDAEQSHLYCKSDCSISGVEIVTHPMTLAWAKESGLFPPLLAKLRDDNCFVDKADCGTNEHGNGCGEGRYCDHSYGLHIHVSRNAFRQARKRRTVDPYALPPLNESYEDSIKRQLRELARERKEQQAINHQMIWLMFLERNSDKLNGDVKLARRDSSQYGAFRKSNLDELRRKGEDNPYFNENRYTAINCQNDKTYEMRFFKSTVDTEEFFAALEFADASVEYTRGLNAKNVLRDNGLDWANFIAWVTDQANDGVAKYPNLSAQINTLQLV